MARQYKIEVQDNGDMYEMYLHDDDNLETLAFAEFEQLRDAKELLQKLGDMLSLLRRVGYTRIEITKE